MKRSENYLQWRAAVGYLLGLELIMAIRPRASAYEYRILAKGRTRFKEGVRPSRADGRWRQIGVDRLGGVVRSLRRRDAAYDSHDGSGGSSVPCMVK